MKRQIKTTDVLFTDRSRSTEMYLTSLPKELLTADEEYLLFQELKGTISNSRKTAIKNKIISYNTRFVVSIAKRYSGLGGTSISFMDLVAAGNLGLAKAVTRFDETKGFKFISYAVWWIRQHITSEISDHAEMIKRPNNNKRSESTIRKEKDQLTQELGREPTQEEMAHLDENVIKMIPVISIYSPYGEDGTMLDLIESPDSAIPQFEENDYAKGLSEELLSVLKPKHRRMVELFYGIGTNPWSKLDIAKEYGTTQENIRNHIMNSLERMKRKAIADGLITEKKEKKREKQK